MIIMLSTLWCVDFQLFFFMLLFFNLITFFGINITSGWRRDTRTILRSIRILNQIYGWKQDHLMNPIEIRCMISLTLLPMTYGRSMFQLLTQTLEFETILDQWVQARMTYLTADCAWLSDETVKLRRLVMKMKLQMGGTCAFSYWPHSPSNDSLSSPPPAPLFYINYIWTYKCLNL
jgi:hypothetical protein